MTIESFKHSVLTDNDDVLSNFDLGDLVRFRGSGMPHSSYVYVISGVDRADSFTGHPNSYAVIDCRNGDGKAWFYAGNMQLISRGPYYRYKRGNDASQS